jgi:hypothetical protein
MIRGKQQTIFTRHSVGTVDSRFPDLGKVVLLSFPRYPGDFISAKYDDAILEKDIVQRNHTFVMNDELPMTLRETSWKLHGTKIIFLHTSIRESLPLKDLHGK